MKNLLSFFIICLFCITESCSSKKEEVVFETLEAGRTGIDFSNNLKPTVEFNMFKYMYFYNGAGVGAGDFNNDGLVDLFFASNQAESKMYLNKGDLRFEDISKENGIQQDDGWSTGVSVVDINNDGLLDIYLCRVSGFEKLQGKNQLFVCQGISEKGIPTYQERAESYGIDFAGFSTQAAFLDHDLDGDLDLYLMNHSVHQNGSFAERRVFLGTYDERSGDRLFRNDGNHYTDVTRQSGIESSAIGYGLGIAVSDINLDGYPDIYIGNDFHENDYLYINQKNGTFKDMLAECTMHTSQFSMGVDIADINNDAFPDIISMDMLPSDPYILKRSLGEDEYNTFHKKIQFGYHPQYAKNALQLNRGNGMFTEAAMYSGVFATDWSWAALFMDFDNDGWKDLFVSNGIPKRLNDIDYVNYVANSEIQARLASHSLGDKEMGVINSFPQIRLRNKFFRNRGNAVFQDLEKSIGHDQAGFSNGAAYADFDNDGDLDVVVNNINDPVLLYRNKTNDLKKKSYLRLDLNGPSQNRNAVGAKVIVYAKDNRQTYENFPVKGFQSSMELPLHLGLEGIRPDSIILIWPDLSRQKIHWDGRTEHLKVDYQQNLSRFDFSSFNEKKGTTGFKDITSEMGLFFRHEENPFVEFDREPLMPHMVSREGPAVAVADINGDGLDDLFLGSSKGNKAGLFLQSLSGRFIRKKIDALENDSTYEDVDASWADLNRDGHLDLVVASGGNEYYGESGFQQSRVYLNNGHTDFFRLTNAITPFVTASCIRPEDFNGDGYPDLFLGGRAEPWAYGQAPKSYLLLNDKTGRFRDVTDEYAKELRQVGFVKQARWVDLDKDGDEDLLVALEWDGIYAFLKEKGKFIKKQLTGNKGWWNFTLPVDVDADGDLDLIAGNTGLNNRLAVSGKTPVKMYYNDFDGNGTKEQILTYWLNGRELPFANKMELEKQMPVLKKKFLYAADFASASLEDLIPSQKLKSSVIWSADYFANAVLINDGRLNFRVLDLPWQAQLTSYRDAAVINANNDSFPDILLGGNFYENNIQMGEYDGDFGLVLINKGNGAFTAENLHSLTVKGQVRKIQKVKTRQGEAILLARNNDSAVLIRQVPFNKQESKAW